MLKRRPNSPIIINNIRISIINITVKSLDLKFGGKINIYITNNRKYH
jgi:hypothetical protein